SGNPSPREYAWQDLCFRERSEKVIERSPEAPMSTPSKRNLATFLLVLGAVVFGMVLAGGLQLTVPSLADQETGNLSATRLASLHGTSLPSFADLAEAVDPAVVSIQAATIEKSPNGRRPGGGGGGVDPFEFFFGPRNRRPQQQQPDGEEQPEEF